MPVYRKCTQCGKKVLDGTLCVCEINKKRKNYKDYKERLKQNETESKLIDFYHSIGWIKLRESVAIHQFGLDLIELSRGNIVRADTYHHIKEVREHWELRLDKNNIIGLTSNNHNKVHAMMNKSDKDKISTQSALQDILIKFELEYYD